jgi:hypothetical protein
MAPRMTDLHVLLPPLERFAPASPLRGWLARGDRLADGEPGNFAALAGYFQWPEGGLPAAALIRQLLAGDAGKDQWLCADPAWIQPELNGARLLACGRLDLSMADAASLADALRDTFADAGMCLDVGDASHWQLRLPAYSELPDFAAPEAALGADLFEHLPKGPEGRRWRALLTEAQVILHQHPLNEQRRQQGRPPINSVWIWGGGMLPATVESGLGRIASDDLMAWALAARAGVDVVGRDAFSPAATASVELLDLLDSEAARIDGHWWPMLEAGLRGGSFHELRLVFASGERWSLRSLHRLRFWRKAPR